MKKLEVIINRMKSKFRAKLQLFVLVKAVVYSKAEYGRPYTIKTLT